MDELELKNENLGHYHSTIHFLFLFNVEHSVSHDFLGGFTLVFGMYTSYFFFVGLSLIYSFFDQTQTDILVKINMSKAALYSLSFVFMLVSIYKNKKYRYSSYISLLIVNCLFYLSFAQIVYYIAFRDPQSDLMVDIFESILIEVVSLYFIWTLYSVTVLIIKEQKYIIFASRREPNFLKDEYKELRLKSEYNLIV